MAEQQQDVAASQAAGHAIQRHATTATESSAETVLEAEGFILVCVEAVTGADGVSRSCGYPVGTEDGGMFCFHVGGKPARRGGWLWVCRHGHELAAPYMDARGVVKLPLNMRRVRRMAVAG